MVERSVITPELCRQLLRYEPDTGRLFWRERTLDLFQSPRTQRECDIWNTRFAGTQAFTAGGPDKPGDRYWRGAIFKHVFVAHRVVFAITTGCWPEGEVDHISGNRSDNRWCNLRVVSSGENKRNARRQTRNKTGYPGVRFDKRVNTWNARVVVGGKAICLGSYKTREEALSARLAANARYGFHDNHGRSA